MTALALPQRQLIVPKVWMPTRFGAEVLWDELGKAERRILDRFFKLGSLKERILLMAGSDANYLSTSLGKLAFGKTAYAGETTIFVGLWAAALDDTFTGATASETAYTSYARMSLTNNTTNFAAGSGTTTYVNTWPSDAVHSWAASDGHRNEQHDHVYGRAERERGLVGRQGDGLVHRHVGDDQLGRHAAASPECRLADERLMSGVLLRHGRITSRGETAREREDHDIAAAMLDAIGPLNQQALIERERDGGASFGPFHRTWLHERAPEKVRRLLELATLEPHLVGMPASQYSGPEGAVSVNPSSFTAVTANATDTNLWVPSIWTPIPANSARAGGLYNTKFGGIFTSTATQGVLTWTPRYGQSATVATNPTLGASNATAPAASLTGAARYGEFTATIRALGLAAAGGTITGNGFVVTQGAAAATGTMYVLGGTVATAFDNTAASGLVVSLLISVASQSYQAQWVSPVRSLL